MALQGGGEDVYATLLLSDNYLPGALVLAHSLRDAGTAKKLAVLVTLDTVAAEVITELKNVFDYVIPVPRIRNEASTGNLNLMNRPDLHSAFTKVNLWKQAQFRKIVYIDADVVAYRAPDELFELPYALAAAPDIGWPDLFNTGVMVLTPDVSEYYALAALAKRGVSFDGADQGLLNMHFKDSYHRLPFTYNVTPSAHYQYLPAYYHFQSSINMVHFIGSEKPWMAGRSASTGGGPYDEMVGQWWSVYDRHYRAATPPTEDSNLPTAPPPPAIVQYFVKGEYHPTVTYILTSDEPVLDLGSSTYGQHSETLPPSSQSFFAYHKHQQHSQPPPPQLQHGGHNGSQPSQLYFHHEHHHHDHRHHDTAAHDENTPSQEHDHTVHAHYDHAPPPAHSPPPQQDASHPPPDESFAIFYGTTHTETREDQVQGPEPGTSQPPAPEQKNELYEPPMETAWDAQWQPPPVNAKPEAVNFPEAHYEMSRDTTPFVPPQRYPSPPRDMWYEVPKEVPAPSYHKPAAIFPWEMHQPAPTRVFAEPPPPAPALTQAAASSSFEMHAGQSGYNPSSYQEPGAEPSMITGSPSVDLKSEPTTPTMPSSFHPLPPSDPWASFARTNAWDDVPQIERYVDAFQKQHHRGKSRSGQPPGKLRLSGGNANGFSGSRTAGGGWGDSGVDTSWRHGSKVTDFPSEVERPSLPVTPAPIRRSKHWGGGGPGFSTDEDDVGADEHLLPAAEGVPQQVDWDPVLQLQKLASAHSDVLLWKLGHTGGEEADEGADKQPKSFPLRPLPGSSDAIRSPTYVAQAPVMSPKPVKPGGFETSSVRNIYYPGSAGLAYEPTMPPFPDTKIEEPSYMGPGVAFEKDDDTPDHGVTAALPTEEEMDVLDT